MKNYGDSFSVVFLLLENNLYMYLYVSDLSCSTESGFVQY
mgnify:CR=1 FL=1